MKRLAIAAACLWIGSLAYSRAAGPFPAPGPVSGPERRSLDDELASVLGAAGFTGTIESQFARKLGRPIDPKLANLGRLLWFDKIHSLHHDNTCGGCHSPANGFGDSQGMA